MSIADLVRDIKSNSTNFINEKKFVKGRFAWQEGYGAFSYSRSQIQDVYNYISSGKPITGRIHSKKNTWIC